MPAGSDTGWDGAEGAYGSSVGRKKGHGRIFTHMSSSVVKEQKCRTSAPGLSCQGENGVQQKEKAVVIQQKVLIKTVKCCDSGFSQH